MKKRQRCFYVAATLVYSLDRNHEMLESIMLSWALTFFVLALIAAVLGFGGIAAGAAEIAKILFFLFLVLFVISLISNFARGRNRA